MPRKDDSVADLANRIMAVTGAGSKDGSPPPSPTVLLAWAIIAVWQIGGSFDQISAHDWHL